MMVLFTFTLIIGRFLSTDSLRWFSNALIPIFSFLFYIIFKANEETKEKIIGMISRIPIINIVVYYAVYAIFTKL
jgi:hypothetical protein